MYMNNEEQSKKISESVLEKIKETSTKPKSFWYFKTKDIGLWILAVMTTLLGALSVSSIIFRLSNISRLVPNNLPAELRPPHEILLSLPFFWLVLFLVFAFTLSKEIRLTKTGYKYETKTVFAVIGVISCTLGVGLYFVGSGYILDRFASHHIPFHPDIEILQSQGWFRPETGFLVGEVVTVGDDIFSLRDPGGALWQIRLDNDVDGVPVIISEGERLGLRGVKDADDFQFTVCDIRLLDFAGRGLSHIPSGERKILSARMNGCGERTSP
jgi:hypothetical protein